jgi:arginine exporter protein ArgO
VSPGRPAAAQGIRGLGLEHLHLAGHAQQKHASVGGRARHPAAHQDLAQPPRSKHSVIATAVALTFLNPHVYLDTVVLLGSLADQQGAGTRWVFAGGAVTGSVLWFSALGYGARRRRGGPQQPADLALGGPGHRSVDAGAGHQACSALPGWEGASAVGWELKS